MLDLNIIVLAAIAGLFMIAFAGDIFSRLMPRQIRSSPNGKMFTARSLDIIHSDNAEYWIWAHSNDSRFTEVAELLKVWWLDIKVRIKLNELLPKTKYTARLIFKTAPTSMGLDAFQEASVSMGSLKQKNVVCISPRVAVPPNVGLPVRRSDGWMELELGQFYCDVDNITGDREVVVGLMETDNNNMKTGLIVGGLEVRPI
ncbi:F-box family protein-like [Rhynchospora pubera]|uniref:F-box family protein-like n=1 Tax=Rhynchospora pubera TaxID=906938 RepID=A0AAV8G8D9_9POAL|nr:F-box family protein-like [Rhynchospora pubera]